MDQLAESGSTREPRSALTSEEIRQGTMKDTDWTTWGRLASRYKSKRARRLLALDGGGIRGVMTLRVLARLEQLLRARYGAGDSFRLAHYFDYIAGTSTGAILAAGLARGMSVAELEAFYADFGKEVFTKRNLLARWRSLYTGRSLQARLREAYGASADLGPEHLQTLLLVVTRNATTDSAWPISSNPSARYNDTRREDCNLRIPLWKLVRASTAAPVFFPPETLDLGWRSFAFVDGGTTSYNNPAFLLARMATEPAYRLGWPRGEKKLLVVSVGTGSAAEAGAGAFERQNIGEAGLSTLKALMTQAAYDQDVNCRTLGRCVYGPAIDREVGDLVPREGRKRVGLEKNLGRAFLYVRYDAELTVSGLNSLGLQDIEPEAVRPLDAVDSMPELARIGDALATKVSLTHFGSFARKRDAPLWSPS